MSEKVSKAVNWTAIITILCNCIIEILKIVSL